MQSPVFEILTWQPSVSVSDEEMTTSMSRFSQLVETLPGFLYQSLYKSINGQWVCIYFWETEEQAHASNEAVAGTPEFVALMDLIQADSLTMEVLSSLQHCGVIKFVD